MTENEFTYWAFLGYSQQDNCEQRPGDVGGLCWGDWLHAGLKTFSVPAVFAGQINARGEIIPERIERIFQDQEEQPDNAGLSENVRKALEQSRYLIIVCSPRSAQSLHVNEAVRYFKQLGRGNRILPIVVAGEPNAGDGIKPGRSAEDECFVPAMRHPVNADGTLDTSRRERGYIFADARHGDDKREILANDQRNAGTELELAKIQLIAGLIGVGFNELLRREQKRRFAEAHKPAGETPSQVQEARSQAQEAQRQLQVLQGQVEAALRQAEEARSQARAAEGKVLEAQQQAREAQSQLEVTRNQVREAQNKVLEVQNLPQDVHGQIQEAQNKSREAQSQLEEARNQVRAAESKVLEAQKQAREAQSRVEEFQTKARDAQSQLEETQRQLQEARNQAQEVTGQIREVQRQAEEARNQARETQGKVLEAQNQAREVQSKFLEAQEQARAAQQRVQEITNQTRDVQTQIQAAQNKTQAARRLTKILALIAVLASLAASIAVGVALKQRKVASQALAKAAAAETGQFDLAQGGLKAEPLRQTLQKFGGAKQDENRLRSLDELAARIPAGKFSDVLNAASVIVDDGQRSHFQQQLLARWVKTDLPGAFGWVRQLPDEDARQRAWEDIIAALPADTLTNALALLNDLKPAPGEPVYTLLFQRWADADPIQAMAQRQQVPDRDADNTILSVILTAWADQKPEAVLDWLKSQPDSESLPAGTARNTLVADLFDNWAAKDLEAATIACQQLPDGTAKEKAWECVLSQRIEKAPASAAEPVKNLPLGDYRRDAIEALCQQWADTDAAAALVWAQSLSPEAERVTAANQIVATWAGNDPQAASQFANQHLELSGDVFGEIAAALAQSDLTAGTNWVANLPAGEKKDAALAELLEAWGQNDPKGMATYALGLPAGDIQVKYLTAACRQLAIRDLPGTVELLKPLADAALRQTILEQSARDCGLPHMSEAAKYVAAMPAGDDQKALIKGLLASWTSADPGTAVNWLVSFPEPNSQPEQVQSVIKAWAQPEPTAVAKWLANAPAGTASEGMVVAFLEGAVAKYPDYAAQWTQSVADETKRQKYQVQVARQWMKTDSSAAVKWIDSLNLPKEIRQQLEQTK